ncbi:cell division protein ZapE [Janthinobacterium fluminis]|uniref:Cell division protein ZapE n=1 Tax=Janthinobacterium fluminis TaxID=2987524 RepID=A0ABT5K690_9BURK|nr:cell division protein ZapE [Janthinobacterium fluminis]MDC8759596.1 cell division protein ZapE [Janthinobacterium fluminis]
MLDEAQVFRALGARGIAPDASQRHAIAAILELLNARTTRNWLRRAHAPLGVYCYGLPGRGKSVVVDTIFALAACPKRRIHFHEFLREIIRRQMKEPAGGPDSLVAVTKRWLSGIELLCFDEFHVHDIADAFLIGGFLDTALELGIRIVLTSNYSPDELLPDPLYHERFRPTIEQIKGNFKIVHFEGARDYRMKAEDAAEPRFFTPLNEETAGQLRQIYEDYEGGAPPQPLVLRVAGRPLQARAAGRALLWADFHSLCVESRSHLDYLDLAERWQGLIVDRVHSDLLHAPSTLQRFIWLVDIFYDRRHAFFIASDHPIGKALSQLGGAHDLSRTLSRLAEMSSRAYSTTPALSP